MKKRPVPFPSVAFVCTNQRPAGHPKPCCADRGGPELRERMRAMVVDRGLEGRVKVYRSGCLGGCEFGPIMMTFPRRELLFGVAAEDLPEVLDELSPDS